VLGDLAGSHPARVQCDDLVVKPGKAPPISADQHWIKPPLTIPRNRQLKLAGVGQHGFAAMAVAVIARFFLRLGAQMMIHLSVKHALRQPLLQLIDQTTALKNCRRVTSRKQFIYHLIRDSILSVRRHKLYSFPPFPRASLVMARTQNFRHTR